MLAAGLDGTGAKTASQRAWSWAALMHRAFGIDVLACAHCGGRLRLIALYDRLSRHTAYERFFAVRRRLPTDWIHAFANVDYRRRLAIVAERETMAGAEIVGVGRYEPSDQPDTGEVAFVLEDGYQGRGLGVLLLDEIVRAGTARGLGRFRADVLGENHRMLRLLSRRTRIIERTVEHGIVSLLFEPK